MRIAKNRGVQVPPGYLIDASGQPTTNPGAVYDAPLGALLPFGDHKGAGLGLICEIMAGALSGAGMVHDGTREEGVYCNNMLSMVFDPARLGGHAHWVAEVEQGTAYLQASPPREGMGPVLLPGEPERLTREEPIDQMTWSLLLQAAQDAGAEV